MSGGIVVRTIFPAIPNPDERQSSRTSKSTGMETSQTCKTDYSPDAQKRGN